MTYFQRSGRIFSLLFWVVTTCAFTGSLSAAINYSVPKKVEDGTGKRVALFLEQGVSGAYLVRGSVWTAGTGWSAPVTLSTTSRSAFSPVITVNKTTGQILAAWEVFDASEGVDFVEAVMYPVNNDWGSTVTISTAGEDAAFGDLQASIDNAGTACIMWTSSDPVLGITSVRASTGTFGASPSWTAPITVAAGQSP